MNNEIKSNYIYFIKWKKELPSTYLQLSNQLNKLGISLIPLDAKEFIEMKRKSGEHIVSITTQIVEKKIYDGFRSKFADVALMGSGLHYHDINSFERDYGLETQWKQKRHYIYHLPDSSYNIARKIALNYFNQAEEKENWPGRRSPTLSKLISE